MSTVLVYSSHPGVRDRVLLAVGRTPDQELGPLDWVETADGDDTVRRVDRGGIDVCILDAEAAPTGGMGISRQLKNEIRDCPSVILLVARRDDAWLARWSLADAVVQHPADPVVLTETLVRLLRDRTRLVTAPSASGSDPASGRHG